MKESLFKEHVKHWLEREGYTLKSMVFPLDTVPKKDVLYRKAYHQLYSKNKRFFIDPAYPEYLFVRKSAGYPDIVAVKNGEAFAFEVKATLENERLEYCIGQCLGYLTRSWMDRIYLIVPKGIAATSFLKEIILKFNLPIEVIELNMEEQSIAKY